MRVWVDTVTRRKRNTEILKKWDDTQMIESPGFHQSESLKLQAGEEKEMQPVQK